MKETMYSGVNDLGHAKMIWVCGQKMAVTGDWGPNDNWRNPEHERAQHFNEYYSDPVDLDRFTDLQVVWERGE